MQAVEETIEALGRPVLARPLVASSALSATIARWRHGPGVVEVPPSSTIRLTMSLVDGRNACTRGGMETVSDRPDGASVSIFSPAEGASVEVQAEADVVQLFLEQSYVEAALGRAFSCPRMFDLHDDGMRTLVMRIMVGSARIEHGGASDVEGDLQALARRIGRHAELRRSPPFPTTGLVRGGLAPVAFRRVKAMIEAALDESGSPGLAEMADVAGLSVTHFVRAFRRHTGTTPHKFIVRRKMERAVSILRSDRLSVAEVADMVGYSTPAHFGLAFREAMGVAPGALRDALTH